MAGALLTFVGLGGETLQMKEHLGVTDFENTSKQEFSAVLYHWLVSEYIAFKHWSSIVCSTLCLTHHYIGGRGGGREGGREGGRKEYPQKEEDKGQMLHEEGEEELVQWGVVGVCPYPLPSSLGELLPEVTR